MESVISVICKVLDWVEEIVTKPEILVEMKEKFFISHEKEVVCKVLDWVNAQDIKPVEQMKEEFFISHFMKEEEEVVITAALDLLTY